MSGRRARCTTRPIVAAGRPAMASAAALAGPARSSNAPAPPSARASGSRRGGSATTGSGARLASSATSLPARTLWVPLAAGRAAWCSHTRPSPDAVPCTDRVPCLDPVPGVVPDGLASDAAAAPAVRDAVSPSVPAGCATRTTGSRDVKGSATHPAVGARTSSRSPAARASLENDRADVGAWGAVRDEGAWGAVRDEGAWGAVRDRDPGAGGAMPSGGIRRAWTRVPVRSRANCRCPIAVVSGDASGTARTSPFPLQTCRSRSRGASPSRRAGRGLVRPRRASDGAAELDGKPGTSCAMSRAVLRDIASRGLRDIACGTRRTLMCCGARGGAPPTGAVGPRRGRPLSPSATQRGPLDERLSPIAIAMCAGWLGHAGAAARRSARSTAPPADPPVSRPVDAPASVAAEPPAWRPVRISDRALASPFFSLRPRSSPREPPERASRAGGDGLTPPERASRTGGDGLPPPERASRTGGELRPRWEPPGSRASSMRRAASPAGALVPPALAGPASSAGVPVRPAAWRASEDSDGRGGRDWGGRALDASEWRASRVVRT